MNLDNRFGRAVDRIANATSIRRTRSEDAQRSERHGTPGERLSSVVLRLEAVADKLDEASHAQPRLG